MKELLQRIENAWKNEFSDVPWSAQPIRIAVPKNEKCVQFKFILDTVAKQASFRPLVKDADSFRYLAEDQYAITIDEVSGMYQLSCTESEGVAAIEIELISDMPVSGRVACLAQPLGTTDLVVIYNSLDREKKLVEVIEKHLAKLDNRKSYPLFNFFISLIQREFNKAAAYIEQSDHWTERRNLLKPFCEKFGVAFNAHGIKRTFKFWSLPEKQAYLDATQDILESLSSEFKNCCLGFGAALGLKRDHDLIGHDDDLDILVALNSSQYPNLPEGLKKIESHLRRNGFKVEGTFFSHLWVRHPAGHRLDVFLGLIEEYDRLSFYPSARHNLQVSDVFPALHHDLLERSLPFPRNLDQYLRQTYGASWMIPDQRFQHPWDRSQFSDIDGPRTRPAILTRGEMNQRKKAMKA